MKKVRSAKDLKVKKRSESVRSTKVNVLSNPKPVRAKKPEVIGSSLDEYKIEEIKLE